MNCDKRLWGLTLKEKLREHYCHDRHLEMASKGGQVFCPIGILWLKIDGSGSARSISNSPWLFDKRSDEGRPNDGGVVNSPTELSAN